MNKHHRIGKHIRDESPAGRRQHKAASNVFFRELARALIEEGLELTAVEPEVEETAEPTPAPSKGEVWVVSRGEKHEGSTVLRVFSAEAVAMKFAQETQEESGRVWSSFQRSGASAYSEVGCDYMTVKKHYLY